MSENINGFDVEDAKRKRMFHGAAGLYATPGDFSLMLHGPREGDPVNEELYGLANGICRTASKARKAGVSWNTIATQWEKAGGGNERLIVSELARVVREYVG